MVRSRGYGALAGIAAAALAIGFAELVAVLTGARSAPLIAVGGVVVDVVPEPLKQFAIDVFGVHDKTALLIGTGVLLAGFAALIGVLATRRLVYGLAGIGVFAVVGVAAALTRANAGPAVALPALLGSAVGAGVLWLLIADPLRLYTGTAAARTGDVDPGAAAEWARGRRRPDAASSTEWSGDGRPSGIVSPAERSGPGQQSGIVPPAERSGPGQHAGPGGADVGPGAAPEWAGAGRPPAAPSPAATSPTGDAPSPADLGLNASQTGQIAATSPRSASTGAEPPRTDRRRFLTATGLVLGGAAISGFAGRWLSTRTAVTAARESVTLPKPVPPLPVVPAGADLNLSQLTPFVTPNTDFYRIDTALVVPQVDPETWQLRIHGRVRNEITLTYAQLLERPMVERYVTLACVSNEVGGDLIGNALWLGTPLKALLDEAGPLDGADQVVGRSVDGFTCGTPTAVMRDGRDALLAVGMNGEPLPVAHGFPVRVVVPGVYGYVSACKWITELELTSFADFDAYWVPRGWSAEGPIKTQSRIDTPRGRNNLTAGPVMVAGVAWAQHRGIERVEVQVDDGEWQPASLAPTVSIDTWVQWSWRWDATPGEHTLRVRATDKTGETQTAAEAPPAPNGATGYHSVNVTVG